MAKIPFAQIHVKQDVHLIITSLMFHFVFFSEFEPHLKCKHFDFVTVVAWFLINAPISGSKMLHKCFFQ